MIEKYCFVSDLDGTFFNDKSVPQEDNLKSINNVLLSGNYFTFATGRFNDRRTGLDFSFLKKANAPICLCNGACYYDPTNMMCIKEECFSGLLFKSIILRIHENYPDIRIRYTDKKGIHFLFEDDIENLSYENWYKVVFCAKYEGNNEYNEKLIQIKNEIDSQIDKALFLLEFSSYNLLELLKVGSTKADFITFLRQYFLNKNIDIRIIGFGDFDNDAEMLIKSDIAVCPLNSTDEIKKIVKSRKDAGFISVNNNNGAIAHYINKINFLK